MRNLLTATVLALALAPTAAYARPHWRPHVRVVVPAPSFRVYVGPWAAGYAPAPRPGWVWVAGWYEGPRWYPGYWRPAFSRPGWTWVAGYWVGDDYVDGYWREAARAGSVWIDGTYDDDGRWIPGYWAPANSADAARERNESRSAPPSDAPPEPPSRSEGDEGEGDVYHGYDD